MINGFVKKLKKPKNKKTSLATWIWEMFGLKQLNRFLKNKVQGLSKL